MTINICETTRISSAHFHLSPKKEIRLLNMGLRDNIYYARGKYILYVPECQLSLFPNELGHVGTF